QVRVVRRPPVSVVDDDEIAVAPSMPGTADDTRGRRFNGGVPFLFVPYVNPAMQTAVSVAEPTRQLSAHRPRKTATEMPTLFVRRAGSDLNAVLAAVKFFLFWTWTLNLYPLRHGHHLADVQAARLCQLWVKPFHQPFGYVVLFGQ